MTITKAPFGVTRLNEPVTKFRLQNSGGMYVDVMDYGCTVTALVLPDRSGHMVDVCLGYDALEEYEQNDGYLGAVVGRYANRIAQGRFSLNGTEYRLAENDSPNHLHGGNRGFDKYVWSHLLEKDRLVFFRTSPHMEEGYPGNLKVRVSYCLTDENELEIQYEAQSDCDTVVNLTNHTYFNLSGHDSGTVLEHLLTLNASNYLENDEHCLPTGKILPVQNTPFDFLTQKQIGRDMEQNQIQLKNGKGYDHNFVLDGLHNENEQGLTQAGVLRSPKTGIEMTVLTTMPGIQFYSGNVLTPRKGKGGTSYIEHSGLCLETQYFPNAVACGNFPSVILHQDTQYSHRTVYRFSL